jgi:hypothetical protein
VSEVKVGEEAAQLISVEVGDTLGTQLRYKVLVDGPSVVSDGCFGEVFAPKPVGEVGSQSRPRISAYAPLAGRPVSTVLLDLILNAAPRGV